jgi:chitin synthase
MFFKTLLYATAVLSIVRFLGFLYFLVGTWIKFAMSKR